MTGFAGAFALDPDAKHKAALIGERLSRRLSRHPRDKIHRMDSGAATICHFDIEAWRDPLVQTGASFSRQPGDGAPTPTLTKICGDPVLENEPNRGAMLKRLADTPPKQSLRVLARCRGTFSVVHTTGDALVVATDKFGSRPVYWMNLENCLIFATSYRVLVESFYSSLHIDDIALSQMLCLGQCLGDRTVFEQIRVLKPGTALHVDTTNVGVDAYHDWADHQRTCLNYREALGDMYDTFLEAVRRADPDERPLAFLSGGLDSRAVVAALLDLGYPVKTFNSSYPHSADHVLGEMAAKHFGTDHVTDLRAPAERLRSDLEPFARYARRTLLGDDVTATRMWSGDGGSVGLGFVYITAEATEAVRETPVTLDSVRSLFKRLRGGGFRCIPLSRQQSFREMAAHSLSKEIDTLDTPEDEKRLYLFYLKNDQMRHLHSHYEDIDISRIEFTTPFFDADLISRVLQLPADWLRGHKFYNDWMSMFRTPADAVPWQNYPGHHPSPLPLPEGIQTQWDAGWYQSREARRILVDVATETLRRQGRHSQNVVSTWRLRVFKLTHQMGSQRFTHEINAARKLTSALEPEKTA